jgi:L-Ala-D/L-Glu epimerase
MKIKAIDTYVVTLPFRFSFGHSLASRAQSTNLIVKVTLDDGTIGYGEGVPRDYVTGEDAATAELNVRQHYAPRLTGTDVSDSVNLEQTLMNCFLELGLDRKPQGASWCALELAVLDAVSKAHGKTVADLKGTVIQPYIRYGAVVPFGGKKALLGLLAFYKLYGFKTVKIKVGKDLHSDVECVKLTRRIMGENVTIRIDANCAWTADQTLRAIEAMAPYKVASIEQPVPADDLDGLKKITSNAIEEIVVDESLCTLQQARQLAEESICSGFNIRLSKVGGFAVSQEMVNLAVKHDLGIHLGAQVGESGILSAAARMFASINSKFNNYEGSMNLFLLRKDLTSENLTAGYGGIGKISNGAHQKGLAVTVDEAAIKTLQQNISTAMQATHAQDMNAAIAANGNITKR